MPYAMSHQIALKIYGLAIECLKDSAPEYLAKNRDKPEKILDEYIAEIGQGQFIDNLAEDREIREELGKLLAYQVDLKEWPDLMNGHGNIIIANLEHLAEWVSDSVVQALTAKAIGAERESETWPKRELRQGAKGHDS